MQVLLNLLGNAIKFTDSGEVLLKASLKDGVFLVSVTDTGPGIAEADLQKIFEEFQQGESASMSRKGGSGLGLPISKRFIEMQGGRIGVKSSPGEGSTFWFTLPVKVDKRMEKT
jgi:signal transduction histidine kinase